jgi:glutamyl-tRNA synthetase
MTVITRFAPSPTGYLHIGGARTALFNWLFTRHHGGRVLLRIEDTDRERSTQGAIDAIVDGLDWLGLDFDAEPVFQSQRAARHAAVAQELVAGDRAYPCYTTPAELQEMRDRAKAEGRPMRYDGRWRDRNPADAPAGAKPVIRLKAPQTGETVIDDAVQGTVRVANEQLDDMVLLRADGTPTYMLSVVVDDHDMKITHVIRGDDHLTNAFRQAQIYEGLGWTRPVFAHIPLIHGSDGAKLSKRHGALGVDAYRDMGYLPEAMRNYLMRLGWAHGDDEIISTEQAIAWFTLDGVGRSPARFDFDKLNHLNAHYIREADDTRLIDAIRPKIEAMLGTPLAVERLERLARGMAGLKARARTLVELAENALFYVRDRPLPMDDKAARLLDADAIARLRQLASAFAAIGNWDVETLETAARNLAEAQGWKLGQIAQPLRAALTGAAVSPGIFEVAQALGKEEVIARIRDAETAGARSPATS